VFQGTLAIVTPVRSSASWNLIASALDETMAIVSRSGATPRTRAIMVEARRLKSSIASWRAIPPRAATRKEVFDTAMQLLSKAGAEAAGGQVPTMENDPPFSDAMPNTPDLDSSVRLSADSFARAKNATAFRSSVPPSPSPVSPSSSAPSARSSSAPPPGPRQQMLAPGVTLYRPKAVEWRPFPLMDGVTLKVLHRELAGVVLHGLVRVAPQARIPRHRHASVEDVYLIEGTLVMGDVTMRAGEYCHSEAGSIHTSAHSPTGCTFLLIGSEKNEILPD
jgi:quercetin dioxygenase-like cupin family protein